MEEYTRNWSRIGAYAIAGIEIALLDIKGKALGAPVAELLGGFCRERVPVVGYLFIDEPEANAGRAAAFVDAGFTELKLKVGRDYGQDHDTLAAIRDRVGMDVKIRIDANMIWSVPAAIKWIRGLERFDLQYVEQPVPDFDVQGLAHVRRSVGVAIAADEACTDMRSALELIKADACDVLVVYPSEAGGLMRARQIASLADAAGKWCAIGSWAELGVATMANAHVVASSSNFPFASDTHYPLQELDVLTEPLEMAGGSIDVSAAPGLGVELDREPQSTASPTSRCESQSSMTRSRERLRGSARFSDGHYDKEGREVSDKPTPESKPKSELSRRDLLVKAGVAGAGAIAVGAVAGGAKAATKRSSATPKRGGKITWALEQDPVHVAPFGAILTSNHWGKQAAYDSLVEWDKNLNLKPALAESWKIVNSTTILFNLRKGVRFHNGKEVTAADVKYSIGLMLAPPLPGSTAMLGQVPSFAGADVVSKYVVRLRLTKPDARVFGFLAWGRYSPIVPEGLYDQINVSRNAIGTGPYRMLGFDPNDKVEYVANTRFWKKGLPYMNAMTLKTLPDEQARIAALRAGAIDGATVSSGQRQVPCGRQQPRRVEGRHGGVPRAADDVEARRGEALTTTSACVRRSTTRSTVRRSSTPCTGAPGPTPATSLPGTAHGR